VIVFDCCRGCAAPADLNNGMNKYHEHATIASQLVRQSNLRTRIHEQDKKLDFIIDFLDSSASSALVNRKFFSMKTQIREFVFLLSKSIVDFSCHKWV